MDEREAIGRLKGGDIGGLEPLMGLYHTRAVRTAYLIARDRAVAEDVAQGAFVRAYEKIGQFDAGRPFGPWFMKIVVNDAVKAASGRERTGYLGMDGAEEYLARLADPGAGPHDLAEAAEVRRRVWRAMEELSPVQRAAIVQRYYLGMTEAEMAGRSGSPPGTIKRRLYDARKGLSKLLRPQSRAVGAPMSPKGTAPVGPRLEASEGGEDLG